MNITQSRSRGESQAGASGMVKVAAMLLLPLLVAAIAACDSNPSSSPASGTATAGATNVTSRAPYEGMPEGKPKYTNVQPAVPEVLEIAAAGALPNFALAVQGASKDKIISYYKGAAEHHNEYSQMPCYCGCAMYGNPHSSLASCFINEVKSSGEVVFTDHSLTCDKCQGIAEMTLAGLAKSQPLGDIRADVFTKYGYTGTWTDTPAP